MISSLSTRAMVEASEDPECVVVDVREMAAFNGWALQHEARGGHLPGEKVSLEVEAPAAGVLLRILVPDETETAIFSVIGIIGQPGEDISGIG